MKRAYDGNYGPRKRARTLTYYPKRGNTLPVRRRVIKSSTAIALFAAAYNSPSRHAVLRKYKSLRFGSKKTKMIMVGRMLFKMGGRYRGKRFFWS